MYLIESTTDQRNFEWTNGTSSTTIFGSGYLRLVKLILSFSTIEYVLYFLGIVPFIVLFVINIRISYAMKALQQRLNVKR